MKQQYDTLADSLQPLREHIDEVDRRIIELVEERFDIVRDVAAYKQRKGLPILDAGREQEKLDALGRLCREDTRGCIEGILEKMMAESRRYQGEHPLRYGLLGRSLTHSRSPQIHWMLGGYRYGLFEREPDRLADFFADDRWRGINVTIPYKRDVMEFCHEISETARACGSVNTVVRRRGDSTSAEDLVCCGYNTDYDGFRHVVRRSGIRVSGSKALVLGSGGASGAVVQVLKDLGADPVVIISRSGEDNYGNLDRHKDAQILVNATPVGMFPKAGLAPVDIRKFPALTAVYDLIYNPLRTRLMLDAEEAGIPAFGGLPMLVAQAARAAQLFAAADPQLRESMAARQTPAGSGMLQTEEIDRLCRQLEGEEEDVILIGMPGAGKTTVGRKLAEMMGRTFVDMDEIICAWTGRTAEELIRQEGSDAFRRIETASLAKVLRERRLPAGGAAIRRPEGPVDAGREGEGSGPDRIFKGPLVVATGGGCVEREENRILLREKGRVVWLIRDLSQLPLQGRPLSQEEGLEAILARRAPLYEAWSDVRAQVMGPEATAASILSLLQG